MSLPRLCPYSGRSLLSWRGTGRRTINSPLLSLLLRHADPASLVARIWKAIKTYAPENIATTTMMSAAKAEGVSRQGLLVDPRMFKTKRILCCEKVLRVPHLRFLKVGSL